MAVRRKLAEAGMKRDVATIARFYSDDFFHTNADGSIMTRAEVLDSYRAAPTLTYDADPMDDEKVQMLGDAAVVSCRVTLKGRTADGRAFTTPFRVTNVFKKAKQPLAINRFACIGDEVITQRKRGRGKEGKRGRGK